MLPLWCPRVKSLICKAVDFSATRIVPIRCKCWSCPFCADRNRKHLIRRIKHARPERFITLTTIAFPGETPRDVYDRCRPQLRRLVARIRKTFGPFEAAIILEFTKAGWPHWHICQIGSYIPVRWLSAAWKKLTGAFIVDIRKIYDVDKAAAYVAKYVTKAAANARRLVGTRVFTFTKHFPKPDRLAPLPGAWTQELTRQHPALIVADLLHRGPVFKTAHGFLSFAPLPHIPEELEGFLVDPGRLTGPPDFVARIDSS